MKILFIIESLRSGGKERRLLSLTKEMKKYGYGMELIIMSKSIHYDEIHDLEIKIHYFERNLKRDYKQLFNFNEVLKKFEPDVVHCWDTIAAIQFAPICKFKKIPFINSMISTAPPKLSLFSSRYIFNAISYPFSDVVLTNSRAGLNSFRVSEKKGKYIYNGLDLSRVQVKKPKERVKSELKISNQKIIGMTASFSNKKDYDTFIEAGKGIIDKFQNVTFIAIGDGPNFKKIKQGIDFKYKNKFKFLGRQSDVESIVNVFDIGVLSTYTEGISNAIMEYMVFEKPVVATDGGGTNELVIDGQTGFLVEQQNVEQMVEKIEFLLENPKISSEMGKKGRERIENYFSIDKMIEKTISLYNEFV